MLPQVPEQLPNGERYGRYHALGLEERIAFGRRINLIRWSFVVWAGALLAQTANYSLLGYERGRTSHLMLATFVLVVGFSWIVVSHGPSPVDVLRRLRQRGHDEDRLDRVYLAFQRDRALRGLVVTAMVPCAGLIEPVFHIGTLPFILAAFALDAALLIRLALVRARVLANEFGTSGHEATELIRFLGRMYESSSSRFDAPGKLQEALDPREHQSASQPSEPTGEFSRARSKVSAASLRILDALLLHNPDRTALGVVVGLAFQELLNATTHTLAQSGLNLGAFDWWAPIGMGLVLAHLPFLIWWVMRGLAITEESRESVRLIAATNINAREQQAAYRQAIDKCIAALSSRRGTKQNLVSREVEASQLPHVGDTKRFNGW